MLKKITKWETEDGKVFDTQEEAEDYMFEQEKEVMTHKITEQPEALRELNARIAHAKHLGHDQMVCYVKDLEAVAKFAAAPQPPEAAPMKEEQLSLLFRASRND